MGISSCLISRGGAGDGGGFRVPGKHNKRPVRKEEKRGLLRYVIRRFAM